MDIRSLTLFLHLADTLHFGRTSRVCHITRSGLTRTIQRLEQEVGEPLFFRNNRSVRLTEAGRLFRDYASETVHRYRRLRHRISAEHGLSGQLSIYCSVTAILSVLPGIIDEFRHRYPDIHLTLSTGDAAMALARLENGEADLTVAARPEQLPPHIRFLKLLQTPLIFIGPRRKENGPPPPLARQLQEGVIMPERGLSRVRCERWLAERGIQPPVSSSVAGNEAMIAMVAMGCGVGVVPRLVLEHSPLQGQVSILEEGTELEPFEVGICATKSTRSNPIIEAFWRLAEQQTSATHGARDEHHPDHQ